MSSLFTRRLWVTRNPKSQISNYNRKHTQCEPYISMSWNSACWQRTIPIRVFSDYIMSLHMAERSGRNLFCVHQRDSWLARTRMWKQEAGAATALDNEWMEHVPVVSEPLRECPLFTVAVARISAHLSDSLLSVTNICSKINTCTCLLFMQQWCCNARVTSSESSSHFEYCQTLGCFSSISVESMTNNYINIDIIIELCWKWPSRHYCNVFKKT